MQIIKKLFRLGTGGASRAVILPKEWIEYHERRMGKELKYVSIEINNQLIITPYNQTETKENR
jgi:antitoxin component of MazEF toxin-antitoxin module